MPSWRKKLFKRSSHDASSAASRSLPTTDVGWPHGLEVVYEGPEASLDIVAIHGLNGHRENTWTADNDVHWLRDLLPKDLPNVRILTWGYDANTHASDRVNCQYIYDHARELVGDLTRMRTLTNSNERPIIFVAHSLGGIVVKSALIHADAARQGAHYEHRSVKTSTYGIIFMGTPHQGGTGVKLGCFLVNIASIFVAADDRVLKHLERDSELLQQQLGQYGPISGDFVTKFAYETYETSTLLGHKMMVVPKASAVVLGQADAEPIAIYSDHIHMVKYPSRNDRGYRKVSENLQIMAKDAVEAVRSRWEAEIRLDNARRNNPTSFSLPLDLSQVTDVPRFVAREDEIQRMHGILRKAEGRRTVILHGLGGIGKTQLAREYIKRHRDHFTAAVWLNARDATSLQQSYLQTAQRIHNRAPVIYVSNAVQNQDPKECVEAVKRWLDEPANDGWIVIYDNYDDPKFGAPQPFNGESSENAGRGLLVDEHSQAASRDEYFAQGAFDIRPFLPVTDHGAIIMTTRSAEVELGEYIRVKKLTDPKSGLDILASTSRREEIDQDKDAGDLVKLLDGLPLALATAGAYLKGVPATTFADYITLYKESWEQLQKSTPRIMSYEDRALYSTWNISFLHIKHQNPASAALLRLWAYFDHEDLWYELLHERRKSQYLQGIVGDRINFDKAIRVLHDHGLIEADISIEERAGESQGYSMHGCVHLWTQHILNEDPHGEGLQMARVAMECVAWHVPQEDSREYWLIERRLLKHVDRCLTRMEQSIQLNKGVEYVWSNLGLLYARQGQLAKAEILQERAL
ncbi:P-loop containing nucleoside triphosphate hydrolase protein [Annulohypoxylon truncatum]|uniref:P-loop containing nucleoside triphosphate hydrolase protein n=1 Tax=Annulohypoxylon truncatum TaxID=327061 RepID=UPI00200795C0|nr:P-loop containing nucleoside triphosphate hydrolase protein [Annulohypoxylon truncatum]KAI1210264.1 P-loop containing nucleoside triphosphate hydrolase protein [Annulohypoxylon truncatum]